MKTYGQFCPLAQAVQLLCERWTFIIIREMIAGSTRFTDLQKGVPLMSPTLLSSRLKHLVKSGVVEMSGSRGSATYHLTQAGEELRPMIELLGVWGHRWAQSNLHDDDLDAGLLMWDMQRSIDSSVFPAKKLVVQFNYPDAAIGKRHWWLVSNDNNIDLCLKDPGFEVDLVVTCSLKTMTQVWICEKKLRQCVENGDIQVLGDPKLADKLALWLRSSALSALGSLDRFPTLNWDERRANEQTC